MHKDVRSLSDAGYATVTLELRCEVSQRIKEFPKRAAPLRSAQAAGL